MTSTDKQPSPKKRYFLRIQDLAAKDAQIGQLVPLDAVREAIVQPELSYAAMIRTVLEGYSDRPALAERAYTIETDASSGARSRKLLPSYSTITYRELRQRVERLASAWRNDPDAQVRPGDFVCILGFTSIDFTVADLACAYAHAVTVPLQTTLAGTDLSQILADTRPAALVATLSDLPVAAELAVKNGEIPVVIAMDYEPRDDAQRAVFDAAQATLTQAGVQTRLTSMSDVIEIGSSWDWTPLPAAPEGPERMAALLHSSGSTGTPKGAIMAERAAKAWWMNPRQMPIIGMGFAPMNHLLGRTTVFNVLAAGGSLYFTASPDMSTLFEDIRLARPTYIAFFPRIFELIYQHYQNEVVRRTKAGGDADAIGQQVRAEMRASYLGDRLLGGSISAAPTSAAVRDFVRDCFDIMLVEIYGTTESGSGGVLMDEHVLRPPVTAYRLRDVPELGYFTSDKPYPRGEFCFKSDLTISGYYKRPEATAGLFDADGFQCTGDIVEDRGADHVVIIDRRNDVQKLSHGEYVAVGPLGTVFESGSALIKQIYIYGNSTRAYLLAVVVPDEAAAVSLLGSNYTEAELKAAVRADMQAVARKSNLRTFDVPRDFLIDTEPFSLENGLLSSVRKRMRPNLKRKYGERLEALYEQLERKQQQDLESLKDPSSALTVLQKIGKLLEAHLHIEDLDVNRAANFGELGGDSLGAVVFSLALEEIFGVQIAADAILSPTGSPQVWAEMIKTQLAPEGAVRPSFYSLHGKGAVQIHGRDLTLDRFLDPATLKRAATSPAVSAKTVLLTGANGFLGHFLCLEWLEKLAKIDGKLLCLIRARSDDAAKARLDAIFSGLDPVLTARYQALGSHLEVLAGDVTEPFFGLSQSEFNRLAQQVDRIVHPAALVNHALAYEHLFGPNVAGTAEIIRLAISERQKPVDFVSTVAVHAFIDTANGNNEDSPLQPTITLGDGYAVGYGASKWAAEQLLHDAHQKFALPVNIFRGDMMLAHQTFKGEINVSDMFTRLLYSFIATGLAPESLYRLPPGGGRAKAHYDGTPVDVIAAAIAGAGDMLAPELQVFNVQNYHEDDGVSLDTIVDWISTAGYPIQRLQDYTAWFDRFRQKLAALPEEQRQHSSLNVLGSVSRPGSSRHVMAGCQRFQALMKGLSIGPDVPHLSEAFIHKCLDDMRRLALIGAPSSELATVS